MAAITLTRRRGTLAALIAVVVTIATGLAGTARANLGLLIEIAAYAACAYGIGTWIDPGAGYLAAGAGILVLRETYSTPGS